jgi:hypothetical protein
VEHALKPAADCVFFSAPHISQQGVGVFFKPDLQVMLLLSFLCAQGTTWVQKEQPEMTTSYEKSFP